MLYKRIITFKCCLQKAIVHCKPLDTVDNLQILEIIKDSADTADNKTWSSSAFPKENYVTTEASCQNCKMVFKHLTGVISSSVLITEEEAEGATFCGRLCTKLSC